MSEHNPTPDDSGAWPLDEAPTAEHPAVADTLTTALDEHDWLAGDDADGVEDEWVSQTTHGIRLAVPVAALITVVLIAGGFWGGAALEKSQNGTGSSSLASLADRFRSTTGSGATGASGFRFGGLGGSSAAATGTISVVDGDTLYVRTSSGSLVKVTLTKSTTVTRNADASAVDLRPGDTVTVQGATGSSGTVAATSVSATAPGVSSGFAGLFGGAPGGTGTTSPSTSSNTSTTPSLFGG